MNKTHYKYIIIGAGLSGFTVANELFKHGEKDISIIESRDRIGGRIYTKNEVELGATWFQNHHTHVSKLIDELKIDTFPQFSEGKSVLVYSSMSPAHYFETDKKAPAAKRIGKGSINLIEALAKKNNCKIYLNTTVSIIVEDNNKVNIETNNGTFSCDKLIVAMPPKIVKRITFSPQLPNSVVEAFDSTHTWMSNAIKVGITYKKPFWRDKKLSGTLIGQIGPVIELYDHCNIDNAKFCLKGFLNEALRDLTFEDRKVRVLNYLEAYFGIEIKDYISYHEKDWYIDKNTSCKTLKSIYMSTGYGNPAFHKLYMNNKIVFAGAETSSINGGYMDGAVYSGITASKKLLNIL